MRNTKDITNLNELKKIANTIVKKLAISKKYLPTFGYSKDFGYPFVEINDYGYNYVVSDRGEEVKRVIFEDVEELMYHIFFDITFRVSLDYELHNREDETDSRRKIFENQEKLLGMINDEWRTRASNHHKLVLLDYPFDDFASKRAEKCQLLKEAGLSEAESWEIACNEFPLVAPVNRLK